MTLHATATVVRASNILSTDVGGETVLFSVENGHYYGLDSIASAIWDELAEPVQIDAVCERIAVQYDGARDEIFADTLELLDWLAELSLVSAVPSDN